MSGDDGSFCISHSWQEVERFNNGVVREHCTKCGQGRLHKEEQK